MEWQKKKNLKTKCPTFHFNHPKGVGIVVEISPELFSWYCAMGEDKGIQVNGVSVDFHNAKNICEEIIKNN